MYMRRLRILRLSARIVVKRTCSVKERAQALCIRLDANVVEATQDEETKEMVKELLGLAEADDEEDDESTTNEGHAHTNTEL